MTWVVPTVTGREGGLARLLESLEDDPPFETLVYHDMATCGAAWVKGARAAVGEYIYFAADDIEAHPGFQDAMVEAVDRDLHPAALVLLPDGSKQSCGGAGQDVCRGDCADWQPVEWSPTPFIHRDWWEHIEPHADMLAGLHYSSDCLVSACLAKAGLLTVMRREAVITHYNDGAGRLWTAGTDGGAFNAYRVEHGM